MKLSDLICNIECDLISVDPETDISMVSSDSSKITLGGMYVCINGMHHDGHDFIPEAIKNGARVIVVQSSFCKMPLSEIIPRLINAGIGLVAVENTRLALSYICSNFYKNPEKRLKLVLITGTNGKTTVSYMLSAIFSLAGYKTGVIGTLGGNMTTPDPEELFKTLYEMAENSCDYAFIEASSHALALCKLAPLRPDVGVITNITPEHLDFHRDMQSYKEAKAKLFDMCKLGFFNMDDKLCCEIAKDASCKKILFSVGNDDADIVAKNARLLGCDGGLFDLFDHESLFRIRTKLSGEFNISNSLAAASVALKLGIEIPIIKEALLSFNGVRGRLERVDLPLNDVSLYIDFAHTPDALLNLLNTIRGFMKETERIVLLFGCGGDRDRSKRPVMGKIASENADLAIITSDNCRTEDPTKIIDQILSGVDKNSNYIVIENRRQAIKYAVMNSEPGDIIVLAGKGHEEYEIIGNEKRRFCEREIAIDAANEKLAL